MRVRIMSDSGLVLHLFSNQSAATTAIGLYIWRDREGMGAREEGREGGRAERGRGRGRGGRESIKCISSLMSSQNQCEPRKMQQNYVVKHRTRIAAPLNLCPGQMKKKIWPPFSHQLNLVHTKIRNYVYDVDVPLY